MPGLKAICLQPVSREIFEWSPWSGRRESNPVFTNPNRTYYRYTTARPRTPRAAINAVCTFQDSNLRPFECESNALTSLAKGACGDYVPETPIAQETGSYFIPTILYFCAPLGVSNEKVSPFFFSINEEPSGERCDILCSCILASAEPTIW